MKKVILRILNKIRTRFQQQNCEDYDTACYCYRGKKYNLRKPTAIYQRLSFQSLHSVSICKFRGVSYLVERHQFPTKPDQTLVCQR